ncbi:MAG: glycoside hydrolase family 2 TIM barrel-domain containing protein, partial [Fimbriimonadales bacterium]
LARLMTEHVLPRIDAAGDLRGHLIGTFSENSGSEGIADAEIKARGTSHSGSWTRSGRTGPNGFFRVDLPFGTTGSITLEAAKGDKRATRQADVADVSWALTPRPPSNRFSLDGTWEWAADPDSGDRKASIAATGLDWKKVKVPAHWEMEGLVAESGHALYRRTFTIPGGWKGKRIKLRADAVYSRCRVFVNGRRVGSHEGGATPFELDITDIAKSGESNEIMAQVDARSLASDLDNASYFAYFELAGIWQPIEVFAVEPNHISHLAVETTYDEDYRNAELSLDLDFVNEGSSSPKTHNLAFRLFDPKGREIAVPGLRADPAMEGWSRKNKVLKATVANPQPWNAESPRLYKLVGYVDGEKVLEQPVGFRQIEIKDRAVTLNGTPLKIRGISKLDAHPLMGRALTPVIDRLDVDMMKGANFNAVRATIFPPHPAALNAADAEGLYYENEGPTCWGNHADDLRYVPIYMGVMCEYLELDRNHPCVIDWSICNESDFARVFSMTADYLRQIDPTRIYSATFSGDALEVRTMHHPVTLQRIHDSLNWSKPAFFDEVLGNFHGWEDLALWVDLDPGMKDYWVEGIADIVAAINAGHNQLGTMEFSWCDDTFLVPGKGVDVWRHEQPPIRYTESLYKMPKRGMVGDVVWGIVDGWRRPRPEYWLSKKLFSPVQIEEKPLAIPDSGPVVVALKNYNQFVDLDRYACRWSLGSEKGEARAECRPMSNGTLRIPVSRSPKPDDVLALDFYDEKGRMVDTYRLTFKPHDLPVFARSSLPARIREQGGYLDSASAVRLIGKDCELAYDRTSGALYRALKGNEVILNAGPTLRLLKSNAPAETYPVGNGLALGALGVDAPTAWKLSEATSTTEGGQVVLNWQGSYGKDLVGGYRIAMDDSGDVEIQYEFKYNGAPIHVREIGLEFAVPLSMDRLEWDRRAEYSVYPADHIGRPHGTAVPHPAVAQTVPPGNRPFGLDDHAWGCNDFRSTKRNIYWASLTNPQGEGVKVISDGTQHIRAIVGPHDILFRVMDWYGGEGWTYHEGYHYGEGKLINTGNVLKGTVRLQLLGSS